MSTPSWKKVDRFGLLAALRGLAEASEASVLIVTGPDDADRTTAADLAEVFFRELGWHPVRVAQSTSQPTTTRQVLARAWRAVEPPSGALEVPRSLGQARHLQEAEIVAEIGESCRQRAIERRVFIFDTIDPLDRVPRTHVGYFVALARETSAQVVVFSRAESGIHVPPNCLTVAIGDMPMAEVRSSLKTSPEFADVDESVIDALLDDLAAAADGPYVSPLDAYDLLQIALVRSGSSGN